VSSHRRGQFRIDPSVEARFADSACAPHGYDTVRDQDVRRFAFYPAIRMYTLRYRHSMDSVKAIAIQRSGSLGSGSLQCLWAKTLDVGVRFSRSNLPTVMRSLSNSFATACPFCGPRTRNGSCGNRPRRSSSKHCVFGTRSPLRKHDLGGRCRTKVVSTKWGSASLDRMADPTQLLAFPGPPFQTPSSYCAMKVPLSTSSQCFTTHGYVWKIK
jgi:hypothetical protein